MRAIWCSMVSVLFAANPAMAESKWLESGLLDASDIRALCEHVKDVQLLARMQMIASGNERWRSLSRRELVVESVVMGVPPLDTGHCYVIARAGLAADTERRAFEIRDFAVGTERTSVFVVGRAYDAP